MSKTKGITLSYPHQQANTPDGKPYLYRIEKVQESVDYFPGQLLDQSTVRRLCEHDGWRVTVVKVQPG